MLDYATLKSVHVASVALSGALFAFRGAWRFLQPDGPLARWARIVPPIVDTLLLLSALALASFWLRHRLPVSWIGVKIAVLIAYMMLGTIALRPGLPAGRRAVALLAAVLAFGFIVGVALTKSPAGALGWLT